ncbi:MAG: sugar phosphate isomerase/epimerase [candidate division WOR-3 bacterium]|nr:sugar phosphate isomerase/epimerase [candidate division WOR-3 bacterium]
MKYKFALQILFDFQNIISAIQFAYRSNFSAVEINLNNFHFLSQIEKKEEREKILEISSEKNIDLLFHAPEGISLFLINNEIKEFSLNFYKKIFDYLSEIKAKRMTIHLGSDFTFGISGEKRQTYEVYPKDYEDYFDKIFFELKEYIKKDKNLFLCVENVGGFRYPFILNLLEKYLGDNFALTLDTGHINRLEKEKRIIEIGFFEKNRDFIKTCHLHDNDGSWDQHNIIGRGNINFLYYFRLLKNNDCYFVFEVRPKEAAILSYENFLKMLKENNEL